MDDSHGEYRQDGLPKAVSVLAVCAHPDDESFGLGATLATFADLGSSTAVLQRLARTLPSSVASALENSLTPPSNLASIKSNCSTFPTVV